MEILKLEIPRGFMEIRVWEFFPCTQVKAKKLFLMVKKYCSPAVRSALGKYLYYNALHWDPGGKYEKAKRNYKLYWQMEVADTQTLIIPVNSIYLIEFINMNRISKKD